MKLSKSRTALVGLTLLTVTACSSAGSPPRTTEAAGDSTSGVPAAGVPAAGVPAAGVPVSIEGTPFALHGDDSEVTAAGVLRYRAGLHLTADHDDFGGFSGLAISADGRRLAAVTDRGRWLFAELAHDEDGTLRGLESGRLGTLEDDDGQPVEGRYRRDAEELVALPGRGFLVTFEGHHRASLYRGSLASPSPPAGIPEAWPYPREIENLDENQGMEAAARLADGRLLIVAEDRPGGADIRAWVGAGGEDPASPWQPLQIAGTDAFQPTGTATLPSGAVLLLERSYSEEDGTRARLSVLEGDRLSTGERLVSRELARLEPPLVVDNMESVAVRQGADGEVLIYVLSDDNFNENQRTLLMQFEYLEP